MKRRIGGISVQEKFQKRELLNDKLKENLAYQRGLIEKR